MACTGATSSSSADCSASVPDPLSHPRRFPWRANLTHCVRHPRNPPLWVTKRSRAIRKRGNSQDRMNISNFFIKRPIFAAVISIIIFVIGALAYLRLPLSEYPEVVPPTVVVRTSYPGANPTVIADTVASPLEQQINGVEGMLYMFSQATADGVMTLTITFGLGTDLDKAQVQVQNRVSQALPRLPQEVQRLGVTTEKTSPDLLMVVHLESPDNRYDM